MKTHILTPNTDIIKPVIRRIVVKVPNDLSNMLFCSGHASFGRACAGWNLMSKPQLKMAYLEWDSICEIGDNFSLNLSSKDCYDSSFFDYSEVGGTKIHFRFRRVRDLGYNYKESCEAELIYDNETKHYPWIWALTAITETGLLGDAAQTFFETSLYPEWAKGYYCSDECTGYTKRFFQSLERFSYENGVLVDSVATFCGASSIQITRDDSLLSEGDNKRVYERLSELFYDNLILTVRKPMLKSVGENFLRSLSSQMRRWISSRPG